MPFKPESFVYKDKTELEIERLQPKYEKKIQYFVKRLQDPQFAEKAIRNKAIFSILDEIDEVMNNTEAKETLEHSIHDEETKEGNGELKESTFPNNGSYRFNGILKKIFYRNSSGYFDKDCELKPNRPDYFKFKNLEDRFRISTDAIIYVIRKGLLTIHQTKTLDSLRYVFGEPTKKTSFNRLFFMSHKV